MTNEELGWSGSGTDWTSDVEIHYTDLYGLTNCELLTHIKSPKTIRKYNEKCMINLAVEYNYITRWVIEHERIQGWFHIPCECKYRYTYDKWKNRRKGY